MEPAVGPLRFAGLQLAHLDPTDGLGHASSQTQVQAADGVGISRGGGQERAVGERDGGLAPVAVHLGFEALAGHLLAELGDWVAAGAAVAEA